MGDDHKKCKFNNDEVKLLMNSQPSSGIRNRIENGDIPEWLLLEVLIRLPSKFVCRFKLVSKEWLSIISDPLFVRAYISRASSLLSSQQQPPWTYILRNLTTHKGSWSNCLLPDQLLLNEVYSQHYSQVAKSSFSRLPLPCAQKQKLEGLQEKYVILRTSSGLVLCGSQYTFSNLYLCNPVTGQWIALPQVTRCGSMSCALGFIAQVEDSFLKSYRVVRLEITAKNNLLFTVFISEIGEWKNVDMCTNVARFFGLRTAPASINGVLYWLVRQEDKDSIVVYDPYRSPKQVRLIECPEKSKLHCLYSEYKGKLSYLQVSFTHRYSGGACFKLWVLNDDHHSGGRRDWSLQHNISNTDIIFDGNLSFQLPYMKLLSFHPFDPDVLYLGCDANVVSLNFVTKKLEIQQKFGERIDENRLGWWSVALLLIPPWPISIPRPSFGATEEGVMELRQNENVLQPKPKRVRKRPARLEDYI